MYLDFYHLKKAPFHITPDPEFLFLSPSHKAALGSIIYGIEERQGFVVISGEVGLGKTTILRSYLERIDPRQLRSIYIFNANVSFRGLLKAIFGEFGLDYDSDDLFEMVNRLHRVLIEEYNQRRNVALIIDEAQNMPVETLENLRMLSNLETNTEKLVQIILIGQPEFDHKLNLTELRQLKQRIVIRSTIEPLTAEESLAYIQHRLGKVASTHEPIFSRGALKQIIETAKGTPRALNILCTNTLIAGFGYRQKPITAKIAKEVIVDFEGKRRRSFCKPAFAVSAMAMAGAAVLWISPYRDTLLARLDQTGHFHAVTEALRRPPAGGPAYFTPPRKDDAIATGKIFITAAYTENHAQEPSGRDHVTGPEVEYLNPDQEPAVPLSQKINTEQASIVNGDHSAGSPEENGNDQSPEAMYKDTEADIFPVIRTIKKGDYVSKLAVEIYGFTSDELIEALKEHNPQIKDMNRVEVGDKVLFPALHVARE